MAQLFESAVLTDDLFGALAVGKQLVLHTLIIHPHYEKLAQAFGFQQTSSDPKLSVYWMYLALDRYLALDIETAVADLKSSL